MKPLFLLGISLLPLLGTLQAATYSTNFNSYPAGEIAGQDGWTINSPAPYLSFIADWNDSYAAALGGKFDIPDTPTVGLTHSYSAALGSAAFSFKFTIRDSNLFTNRDTFGFGLKNGTSNLFAVYFTPSTQSTTPVDETAQWNLSYVAGAGPSISLTQGVMEGGTYTFSLAFTPNGTSTDFDLAVTGSNTENRSGTFALDPQTTMITDLGILWNAYGSDPDNVGDNFFIMDNLVAVPEPSSALLFGLAGLGFMTRRKRA